MEAAEIEDSEIKEPTIYIFCFFLFTAACGQVAVPRSPENFLEIEAGRKQIWSMSGRIRERTNRTSTAHIKSYLTLFEFFLTQSRVDTIGALRLSDILKFVLILTVEKEEKGKIETEMQQNFDKIPDKAINLVCPAYCSRLVCNQRQCVVRPESVYGSDRYAAAVVCESDLLQKTTTRKAPISRALEYTPKAVGKSCNRWKIMQMTY